MIWYALISAVPCGVDRELVRIRHISSSSLHDCDGLVTVVQDHIPAGRQYTAVSLPVRQNRLALIALNLHVTREAPARDRAEPDQLTLRTEDLRSRLDRVARVGDDVPVLGIRIPARYRHDRRV